MVRSRHVLPKAALLLLAGSVVGCSVEKPTSVVLHEGPSFEFAGSGRLVKLTVYAPRAGRRIASASAEASAVIWQIIASRGDFTGDSVAGLRVVYGVVPAGYLQTIPDPSAKAESPPAGVISAFFAETVDAPGVGGAFFTSATGPVAIDIQGPCLRRMNGHEIEVDCQTKEPYREPYDIEKFVQAHRIAR